MTDNVAVILAAREYFYWALAIPLAGFAAFLWDGILVGATATREMLWSMLVAVAGFFSIFHAFPPGNNHALWLSFIVYLALRGIVQTLFFRKIERTLLER